MVPRRLQSLLLVMLGLVGLTGSAAAEDVESAQTALPRPWEPGPRGTPMQEPGDGAADGWSHRIEDRLSALERRRRPLEAPSEEASERDSHLARALDRLLERTRTEAEIAMTVRAVDSGKTLFDRGGDHRLNPASNQKLLTAAAAVELLGPDYRFETDVARDGSTLYLVGHGDPSLQVEDLERLAEQVAAATDLSTLERLVIDDSAFSSRRFGPGYDPEGPGYSYMAPSGALSLQFNTVEVEVRGRRKGQSARVRVSPPCEHVEILSTAATRSSGHTYVTTEAHGDHTRVRVHGSIAPGRRFRIRRRITDPGHFTASVFAAALERLGGPAVLPIERGRRSLEARDVATHRSAPLPEVLSSALKFSNNFTTEQVLRTLGHRMTGEPGDWSNGTEALRRFWAALEPGQRDLVFENASGLSERGRITARGLVDVLDLVTDPDGRAFEIIEAMPLAGREGTLATRLQRVRDRVRAKTGTLDGASALSGVVLDEQGRPAATFSILINGPISAGMAQRIQDRLVQTMVKQLDRHSVK